MNTRLAVVLLGFTLIVGCSSKEEQLQERLSESEQKRQEMNQFVAERDSYMVEVIGAVNAVYADLEQARASEGKLLHQAENAGKNETSTSLDTRQKLIANIGEIGTTLKENRKRISELEARSRASNRRIASLDTLIGNLRQALRDREESIAMLEAKVLGLETTVAENSRRVAERDSVISEQRERMNTAYFIVGTREQLEEKGIITNQGGFLWGLLGSTTVLASGIDSSEFISIDRTKDQLIRVTGRVDEIIPSRQDRFFSMAQRDDEHANLVITNPNKFWQDRYLVIVVD